MSNSELSLITTLALITPPNFDLGIGQLIGQFIFVGGGGKERDFANKGEKQRI